MGFKGSNYSLNTPNNISVKKEIKIFFGTAIYINY